MFEFDPNKNKTNIEKHGLDFIDAIKIFASETLIVPATSKEEPRKKAIGVFDDVEICIIFTVRSGIYRIISARRAKRNEREHYHTHVSGRNSREEGPD